MCVYMPVHTSCVCVGAWHKYVFVHINMSMCNLVNGVCEVCDFGWVICLCTWSTSLCRPYCNL